MYQTLQSFAGGLLSWLPVSLKYSVLFDRFAPCVSINNLIPLEAVSPCFANTLVPFGGFAQCFSHTLNSPLALCSLCLKYSIFLSSGCALVRLAP